MQAAVGGNLVVFDLLRGADQRGVDGRGAFEVGRDFVALFQQSHGGIARFRFGFHAERLEDLFELPHLAFGFLQVRLERFLQVIAGRGLDHLRQRLDDAVFGVIHVRQFIQK